MVSTYKTSRLSEDQKDKLRSQLGKALLAYLNGLERLVKELESQDKQL